MPPRRGRSDWGKSNSRASSIFRQLRCDECNNCQITTESASCLSALGSKKTAFCTKCQKETTHTVLSD